MPQTLLRFHRLMKLVWKVKSASRWPNSSLQKISIRRASLGRQVEDSVPGLLRRQRGVVARGVEVQVAGPVLREDLHDLLEGQRGLIILALGELRQAHVVGVERAAPLRGELA